MPFFFKHPDQTTRIDLDDLPLDSWIAIQEATGKTWPQLVGPGMIGDAAVAKVVVAEVCKHLGAPVPAGLTLKSTVALFEYDEGAETTPTQYTDGMPDPKVTGSGPETT